jgi:DNA repair protein RadC
MKHINVYSLRQVKESSGLYEIDNKKITRPEDAQKIISAVLDLGNAAEERFGIITLTTKNDVAGIHVVHIGLVDSTFSHPREMFKNALLNNAVKIVCFHNHPSGDPTPSEQDIRATTRIVEASKILGIEVLDHLIIGENNRYVSMKEQGMM